MEKEGLVRAMNQLEEEGLQIERLVTDRHVQIAKWVKETHPEIDHRYDIWHTAKCRVSCTINFTLM